MPRGDRQGCRRRRPQHREPPARRVGGRARMCLSDPESTTTRSESSADRSASRRSTGATPSEIEARTLRRPTELEDNITAAVGRPGRGRVAAAGRAARPEAPRDPGGAGRVGSGQHRRPQGAIAGAERRRAGRLDPVGGREPEPAHARQPACRHTRSLEPARCRSVKAARARPVRRSGRRLRRSSGSRCRPPAVRW
jgi:hypothetical protein